MSGRMGRHEIPDLLREVNSKFAGTVGTVNTLTNLHLKHAGDPAIYRPNAIKTKGFAKPNQAISALRDQIKDHIAPFNVDESYIFWKMKPILISRKDYELSKMEYFGTCNFIIIWNKAKGK